MNAIRDKRQRVIVGMEMTSSAHAFLCQQKPRDHHRRVANCHQARGVLAVKICLDNRAVLKCQ
jgi:hypothetical protein